MCKDVGVSDQGRRWLREGGENCLKYLKKGWNRKEGRGNKDFKKGGKLGQGVGALERGLKLPYKLCYPILGAEIVRAKKCLQETYSALSADIQTYNHDTVLKPPSLDIKKKLYGPFLWMGFNCLTARATSRRQFTFYH